MKTVVLAHIGERTGTKENSPQFALPSVMYGTSDISCASVDQIISILACNCEKLVRQDAHTVSHFQPNKRVLDNVVLAGPTGKLELNRTGQESICPEIDVSITQSRN